MSYLLSEKKSDLNFFLFLNNYILDFTLRCVPACVYACVRACVASLTLPPLPSGKLFMVGRCQLFCSGWLTVDGTSM